jgi:hypothetical protein
VSAVPLDSPSLSQTLELNVLTKVAAGFWALVFGAQISGSLVFIPLKSQMFIYLCCVVLSVHLKMRNVCPYFQEFSHRKKKEERKKGKKWLTLMLCIQKVLGSKSIPETRYPERDFWWFSSVPKVNARIIP